MPAGSGIVSDYQTPRLGRIVIATDFSEPARAAAEWVVRVLAPDAEVLLVHALDVEAPAALGDPWPTVSEAVRGAAHEFAVARLRAAADALGRPTARVEVPAGPAAPAIAALAENWGADLIVVGPHGDRTPSSTRLGTTAERLIRTSPVPVLLATGTDECAARRIVAPVDEVDLTAAVLEWTRLLARRDGAEVTLMHVLEPGQDQPGPSRPDAGSDDAAAPSAATPAWLAGLAGDLAGPVRIDVVVGTGTPGEHVLAAARRSSADLIVMGRRGRGRVLPGVLGSTASVVLRGTTRPVLVVVDPRDAIVDDWAVESSPGA